MTVRLHRPSIGVSLVWLAFAIVLVLNIVHVTHLDAVSMVLLLAGAIIATSRRAPLSEEDRHALAVEHYVRRGRLADVDDPERSLALFVAEAPHTPLADLGELYYLAFHD